MNQTRNVRLGVALLVGAIGLLILWLTARHVAALYIDSIWFPAQGFGNVYWKILFTRSGILAFTFAATLAALAANLWVVRRACPEIPEERWAAMGTPHDLTEWLFRWAFGIAAFLLALLFGLSVAQNWQVFMSYWYGQDFGIREPAFGKDAGFYVFQLPAQAYVLNVGLIFTLLLALVTSLAYFVRGGISVSDDERIFGPAAFTHVSILGAVAAIFLAGRFWLSRYYLVFSKRGAVFGAGYTDLHAMAPALALLTVATGLLAVWFVVNARSRRGRANVLVLLSFAAFWFFAGSAYPWAVQSFIVRPNEWEREEEYIARNIEFTRYAYGLDQVETIPFPADGPLTPAVMEQHAGTRDNLKLWDRAPLLRMYNQAQRIRLYYSFNDVDVDRYRIDGELRPVMVAARELAQEQLPEKSQVWTNLRLQYTHGFGLCMSLGNEVTTNGLPRLLVRDVPPVSLHGLTVDEPRVYYGERPAPFVFINTRMDEFDFPGGEQNHFNRYTGAGGIPVGGAFRRAILAWLLGDKGTFFTRQFTDESRVLLFRQVRGRVGKILPFAHLDEDPYLVLHEGRLLWVIDGYTSTRRFPYSEAIGIANYWRNSVKATVDAYDGTVTVYRVDETDPVLDAYARAFPDLLTPESEIPPSLRNHLRYPKDLFRVQTTIYRRYHMSDPKLFFNAEDMWTFPRSGEGMTAAYEDPLYMVMQRPGSDNDPEFLLSRAFTVEGRDNMIAWMAAGCDPQNYGRLWVYRLPKHRNIYGPNQAKGRFNQDPRVSQFMTLMGQLGSNVIQSKVRIIPVGNTLLYLQALYIEDPQVEIPELKQIVLGHGDRVVMAPGIDEALALLLADEDDAPLPHPVTLMPERPAPGALATPMDDARETYRRARELMRDGDWAGFGQTFDELGLLLDLPDGQ